MYSVVFIGPRGSGKTTTGKELSSLLQMPFVDADEVFTKQYGLIKDFVSLKGWEEFRRAETGVIEQICQEYKNKRFVFAPGGGAVAHNNSERCREKNAQLLKEMGTRFYLLPSEDLEESAGILVANTKKDRNSADTRPSLTGSADELKEMLLTLRKRHPLYLANSDFQIYFGQKSAKEVAKEIFENKDDLFC